MPGKSRGTGGGQGVVKWNDGSQRLHWDVSLPTVLDREKNYYEQRVAVGEAEIDNAVRTWFQVYHSLVWLVAATNQKCYYVNHPYTGTVACDSDCHREDPDSEKEHHCLKESHLVPAFDDEESGEIEYNSPIENDEGDAEVGLEVRKGWIFEGVKVTFDKKMSEASQATSGSFFSKFRGQLIEKLEQFLNNFKPLPSNFAAAACLDRCLESRSEMGFAPGAKAPIYIDEALKLIKNLWSEQELEDHLAEMRAWLAAASSEPAGFEAWLGTQLNLASIEARIDALFKSNNLAAKKKVSRWEAVFEINFTTFNRILTRLQNLSDTEGFAQGLEAAIEALPRKSASTPQDWKNLVFATYGAVAWQIFRQVSLAVEQVRGILDEADIP
jgi:hypothetical protein